MNRLLADWKLAIDRFWLADAPDYRQATLLAAEMAASAEPALQRAAVQALPSLRNAMLKKADRGTKELAHRRLSLVRDVLHVLTAPHFGKRGGEIDALSPEQHYREMLGLPFGRRLSGVEIHQAYKRAAKAAHPDGGGSARQFHLLSAARDALMRER
jgi:hypothetical protein